MDQQPAWAFRTLGFATFLAMSSMVAAAFEFTPLTLPGQAQPSVAVDLDGGFILTHTDRHASSAVLRFAVLDRDGDVDSTGEIARGNDWFVNWADFPNLAVAANGDWVTFFLQKIDKNKPYAYSIQGVRSIDRGAHWSAPRPLHDDGTSTEHGFVSLLADGDDRVLAVWLDGRQSATNMTESHEAVVTTLRTAVLHREHEATDAHQLDDLTCDCCTTDAITTQDGPLVVYRDRTVAEIRDIGMVRRERGHWTTPAIVHGDHWLMPGCPVNGPALAMAGGRALALWYTLANGVSRVRIAVRERSAWALRGELEAHADLIGRVDAAPWGEDGALVSWIGVGDDGPVLRLAELDRAARIVRREDIAALPPGRMTGMPRLAASGDRAVLVWTDPAVRGGKVRGIAVRNEAAPRR